MNSLRTDYNVLTFHERLRDQERFKWYFYNRIPCVATPQDIIPPFQVIKPRTGLAVNKLVIKDLDGTETDILTEMNNTGLQVLQPTGVNYDIVMYLGNLMLAGFSFDNRTYYLEMESAGKVWTSETFKFIRQNQLWRYIVLEWCHNGNFYYPGGHIQYTNDAGTGNGYKNRIYLNTSIGKPEYPTDNQFDQRGGFQFPTLQISSKEYRMAFLAYETILDALRVVNQHDMKRVYAGETWHDLDRFLFNQEWEKEGDIALVTASLFTDTVIVETAASGGPESQTCEVTPSGCIVTGDPVIEAKAILANGGAEWVAGQYYDSDGVLQNLTAGDYIGSGDPDALSLRAYLFNAPDDYTVQSPVVDTFMHVENESRYYFFNGAVPARNFEYPGIFGMTPLTSPETFYGRATNERSELWLEDELGAQVFVKVTTDNDLNIGEQIESEGYKYLVLKTVSLTCGVIDEFKFEIPLDYIIFTAADDDSTVVLTGADDDDSIVMGGSDLPSIPSPT